MDRIERGKALMKKLKAERAEREKEAEKKKEAKPTPSKKGKLKCYTLTAKVQGHRYVTCDDKATASKAMTKVKEAMKEVNGIKGKPKLKKQFAEKAKAEIDRDLPDDVLKQIKDFAAPRKDIIKIPLVNLKATIRASSLVERPNAKIRQTPKELFDRFIKGVKEEDGDYKKMELGSDGIIYYKAKPRIEEVIIRNTAKKQTLAMVQFPVNGYGGKIKYYERAGPGKELSDELNEFNINKTKKFEKTMDKFREEGFEETSKPSYNPRFQIGDIPRRGYSFIDEDRLDIPLYYFNPRRHPKVVKMTSFNNLSKNILED